MIDKVELKNTYRNFSDSKLIQLIENEAHELSNIALDALVEVINEKNIAIPEDSKFIHIIKEKKENIERENAWIAALNLKRDGASEQELVDFLYKKGIGESETKNIIKRLPKTLGDTTKFEQFISEKSNSTRAKSSIAILLMLIISIGMFLQGARFSYFFPYMITSFSTFVVAIYIYIKNKGDFKSDKYWIDLIKNNPEEIVWIKPIKTTTKLNFVITLSIENYFQLITNKGVKISLKCNDFQENQTFLNGVEHFLPHAHIGYSEQIENIFNSSPESFINTLKKEQLYSPIDMFKVN